MIIELEYVTVHYECGCITARPVQRPRTTDVIYSPHQCKVCQERERQAEEWRKANPVENMQVRYLVDGKPMTVARDKDGYWRACRSERGKRIKKYFGKSDPRPLLEEAGA